MKITHLILLLILGTTVYGQDVVFKANGPKYVRIGEQFQIQYSVNKSIDDFTPPNFSEFDFLGGPMQGSSTNITMSNGKTVRNQTFTFTYYLRAKKSGKFTLQPASVIYQKAEVKSNAIQIEVVGSSSSGQNSSSTQSSAPASSEDSGEDIFVQLVTDKKTAYVGEGITAWIKIYTKVSLSDLDRNYKGPVFSGFYKQDVETESQISLEKEKVGNEIYHAGLLDKVILYPQRSGEIVIEPFELNVYMQKQVRQSRSVFDDFFGPSYKSVPVLLKSKAVKINVKALPPNQPEGFTGAVGNFDLSASLNDDKVKINDAVSFKVKLSGDGNIKLVENLNYTLPSTMQTFDPVVKTRIDKSGKSGSKTFEITAVPRHSGTIDIKPFKLVYFDPKAKKYKTLQTQDFSLEVERGDSDSTSIVISNLSKEDVELLGSDIRYIKTVTKLDINKGYLIDKVLYKLSYILLALAFVVIVFLRKEQLKRNSNTSKVKHKKASKIAGKRFKKSKELLIQNKIDLFYEEISKALWGYISDKLNIPLSTLSSDNAKQSLRSYNVDDVVIDELFDTISNCEFARYAPGAATKEPKEVYDDAIKLLLKIEQNF